MPAATISLPELPPDTAQITVPATAKSPKDAEVPTAIPVAERRESVDSPENLIVNGSSTSDRIDVWTRITRVLVRVYSPSAAKGSNRKAEKSTTKFCKLYAA